MTAELAVALPAVTLLLAGLLVSGQAAVGQVRCADAAAAGARAAARGEAEPAVVAEAARRAPDGAHVTVTRAGGRVQVVVRVAVSGAGWTGLMLRGSATAAVEADP